MTHVFKPLMGAVVALGLSGCVITVPATTSGVIEDPTAPDWTLLSYVPDPNMNTSYQTDPVDDASFATILNDTRISNGVSTVTHNAQLDQAAQSYAGYLFATDQFSHTAGNSTIGDRVSATGYAYKKVGENLAKGYTSEPSVVDGWENSPGHKANQNNPVFEEFGLGISGTGQDTIWVLVLGDPQ